MARDRALASLMVISALLLIGASARADVGCDRDRDEGYRRCKRDQDGLRGECGNKCARCDEAAISKRHDCEAQERDANSHCDRCAHDQDCKDCGDNQGCKGALCNDNHRNGCWSACGGMRQAVKGCWDSYNGMLNEAGPCRGAWCGNTPQVEACYHEADVKEDVCKRNVEADHRTCTHRAESSPKAPASECLSGGTDLGTDSKDKLVLKCCSKRAHQDAGSATTDPNHRSHWICN